MANIRRMQVITIRCEELSWAELIKKERPMYSTVKPVCNDHLYNEFNYLWFIQ